VENTNEKFNQFFQWADTKYGLQTIEKTCLDHHILKEDGFAQQSSSHFQQIVTSLTDHNQENQTGLPDWVPLVAHPFSPHLQPSPNPIKNSFSNPDVDNSFTPHEDDDNGVLGLLNSLGCLSPPEPSPKEVESQPKTRPLRGKRKKEPKKQNSGKTKTVGNSKSIETTIETHDLLTEENTRTTDKRTTKRTDVQENPVEKLSEREKELLSTEIRRRMQIGYNDPEELAKQCGIYVNEKREMKLQKPIISVKPNKLSPVSWECPIPDCKKQFHHLNEWKRLNAGDAQMKRKKIMAARNLQEFDYYSCPKRSCELHIEDSHYYVICPFCCFPVDTWNGIRLTGHQLHIGHDQQFSRADTYILAGRGWVNHFKDAHLLTDENETEPEVKRTKVTDVDILDLYFTDAE